MSSKHLQQHLVEVPAAVVEPELALLQVQQEDPRRHPVELRQPTLRVRPERLNPVDVVRPEGILPLAVPHPVAQAEVDRIDGADAEAGEAGGIRGGEVKGEAAEELAELALADLRVSVVAVNLRYDRKLSSRFNYSAS